MPVRIAPTTMSARMPCRVVEEERRDLGIGDDRRSGARHRPAQQEQRCRREQRKRNQLVDEVGLGEHAPGIAQVPDRIADDGLSRFPHGCPASIWALRNKLNRRAPGENSCGCCTGFAAFGPARARNHLLDPLDPLDPCDKGTPA